MATLRIQYQATGYRGGSSWTSMQGGRYAEFTIDSNQWYSSPNKERIILHYASMQFPDVDWEHGHEVSVSEI